MYSHFGVKAISQGVYDEYFVPNYTYTLEPQSTEALDLFDSIFVLIKFCSAYASIFRPYHLPYNKAPERPMTYNH